MYQFSDPIHSSPSYLQKYKPFQFLNFNELQNKCDKRGCQFIRIIEPLTSLYDSAPAVG